MNIGYIYILTDDDDALLYIGCSNNPNRRIKEHLSARPSQANSSEIANALVAFAGTIEQARICESWLIHANKPPWNTVYPIFRGNWNETQKYLQALTFEKWRIK